MATPQLTPIEFEALTRQLQEEEFFDLFAPRQPQDEPQQIRNVPTEPDVSSPQVRSQEEPAFPSVGMVPRQPATMDQSGPTPNIPAAPTIDAPTPQYPAERPMSFPASMPGSSSPLQGITPTQAAPSQSGNFPTPEATQAAPSLGSFPGLPSFASVASSLSNTLSGPSRSGTADDKRELIDAIEDLIEEVKKLRESMEKDRNGTGGTPGGGQSQPKIMVYPPVRPATASPSRS